MKLKLHVDSRDWHFHRVFGQQATPVEFSVTDLSKNPVQPLGDVKCTAYSITDIARAMDGVEYDIDFQFAQTPHDDKGASPQDAFSVATKIGLLPKGYVGTFPEVEAMKHKKPGYFRCDTGGLSPFLNVISAMWMAQSPIGVATYWYAEWAQGTQILPQGQTPLNGHMYEVTGVKIVNNERCLVTEAWTGMTYYMNETVFNSAMNIYGSYAGTLASTEQEMIELLKGRKISIMRQIIDTLQNIIILLQQKLFLK